MSLDKFRSFDQLSHSYETYAWDNTTSDQGVGADDGKFSSEAYYQSDNAFSLMNTGFGRSTYDHNWGDGGGGVSTISFGCHIKAARGSGGTFAGNSDFFQGRHRTGGGTTTMAFSLAVRTNGRIQLWRGGTGGGANFTGSLVEETAAGVIEQDVWNWFEFTLTPTSILILKNGVEVLNETGSYWADIVTRAGIVWESFGFEALVYDNFYLRTDTALYGEVRITSNFPGDTSVADVSISNLTAYNHPSLNPQFSPFPTYAGKISDRKDFPYSSAGYFDEDTSYLSVAAGTTGTGIFAFLRWYPVGTIKALQVLIAVRGETGSTGSRIRPIISGSTDTPGDWKTITAGSNYKLLQWIYTVDPEGSAAWDEEDFIAGRWNFGFEVQAGTGYVRITQLSVERIHEAGGGSTAEYGIH